jgi:hypothetical protein
MTIPEYFARIWEILIGRVEGPLSLRFIFQPRGVSPRAADPALAFRCKDSF